MFDKRVSMFLAVVVIGGLLLTACATPTGVSEKEVTVATSTPTCPPIAGPITASVPDANDVSSVTIPDGTWGYYDPGGGYWCATGDLQVEKIDVDSTIVSHGCFYNRSDTTPPCSPYGALAAVDVRPSNVSFTATLKPALRYDLVVSPPTCKQRDEACYYSIYQLIEPVPTTGRAWRWVGSATETTYSGKAVAEGNINHFSIFALVELPEPRPALPLGEMIVASDFLEDDQGDVLVALEILDANLEEVGQTRLFRFSNVDPAFSEDLPEECLELRTPAEQLTCLFPIDTVVIVEVGVDDVANQVSIVGVAAEYEARLFADVQIH